MGNSSTKQYLANLTDERNSAALYRTLAEIEENPKVAEVYRRMATTEEAHAATWAEKLKAANAPVPPPHLDWVLHRASYGVNGKERPGRLAAIEQA